MEGSSPLPRLHIPIRMWRKLKDRKFVRFLLKNTEGTHRNFV